MGAPGSGTMGSHVLVRKQRMGGVHQARGEVFHVSVAVRSGSGMGDLCGGAQARLGRSLLHGRSGS